MALINYYDDTFVGSDTTIATPSPSPRNTTSIAGQGAAGAWIDNAGWIYNRLSNTIRIQSAAAANYVNSSTTYTPANCLYRPSAENFEDGMAVLTFVRNTTSSHVPPCISARWDPAANGGLGSGYSCQLSVPGANAAPSVKLERRDNAGSLSTLINLAAFTSPEQAALIVPATWAVGIKMVSSGTSALVRVYIWDGADFAVNGQNATPLAVYPSAGDYTDTAALNRSSSWGFGLRGAWPVGMSVTRFTTFKVGTALSANSISPVTPSLAAGVGSLNALHNYFGVLRTKGFFSVAPTGGTGVYTYQWYRVLGSNLTFTPGAGNIISGATSSSLNDTGLSPGTIYTYKCVVTDSSSATDTTAGYAVTTATEIILAVGDSITAGSTVGVGQGATALMAGSCGIIILNQGHNGTDTTDWQPGAGSGYLTGAMALAVTMECTSAMAMWGTNDATAGYKDISVATYASNLTNITNTLAAQSWCRRVYLNTSPYPQASGAATIAATRIKGDTPSYYTSCFDVAAASGGKVLMNDATAYDLSKTNAISNGASYYADQVHFNIPGNAFLGNLWTTAYQANNVPSKPRGPKFNGGLPALNAGINQ